MYFGRTLGFFLFFGSHPHCCWELTYICLLEYRCRNYCGPVYDLGSGTHSNLYSYQKCMRIPVVLYPQQHLLLSDMKYCFSFDFRVITLSWIFTPLFLKCPGCRPQTIFLYLPLFRLFQRRHLVSCLEIPSIHCRFPSLRFHSRLPALDLSPPYLNVSVFPHGYLKTTHTSDVLSLLSFSPVSHSYCHPRRWKLPISVLRPKTFTLESSLSFTNMHIISKPGCFTFKVCLVFSSLTSSLLPSWPKLHL